MLKTTIILALPLLVLSACKSPQQQVTLQDPQGNYVTTADFHAMQRTDFVAAIKAGVADYDGQMKALRTRANELGGDSLREFADCESKLLKRRTDVVNQLSIAENALESAWPKERAKTVDTYMELREEFTEAQKDVLDA